MMYYQVDVLSPGSDEWQAITRFDEDFPNLVVWDGDERLTLNQAITRRNLLAVDYSNFRFEVFEKDENDLVYGKKIDSNGRQ